MARHDVQCVRWSLYLCQATTILWPAVTWIVCHRKNVICVNKTLPVTAKRKIGHIKNAKKKTFFCFYAFRCCWFWKSAANETALANVKLMIAFISGHHMSCDWIHILFNYLLKLQYFPNVKRISTAMFSVSLWYNLQWTEAIVYMRLSVNASFQFQFSVLNQMTFQRFFLFDATVFPPVSCLMRPRKAFTKITKNGKLNQI